MTIPTTSTGSEVRTRSPATVSARILFATDPICSHCWAMEPAWRRFQYLYAGSVEVTNLYGGLLQQWDGFRDSGGISEPSDIPPHWAEVAERYGQPIDPSVWLSDPLSSSSPASIAAHAVRALAPEREDAYLRRLRQALFLEARNIARPEILVSCAVDIGLDPAKFETALNAPASEAAFMADLEQKRTAEIRGFPTLIVSGPANEEPWVMRGAQPFFRLERALEIALGELPPAREVQVEELLEEYRSGTTREFAEVLDLDTANTEATLRKAGAESRPLAGSHLWSAA